MSQPERNGKDRSRKGVETDAQQRPAQVRDPGCETPLEYEQALEYVYASWQKAAPDERWDVPDCRKRHPEFTRPWLSAPVSVPAALVTGSKGKGSTARMLSALLNETGRCGLLTSPHLLDFRERIQLAGSMIGCSDFARFVTRVKSRLDTVSVPQGQFVSPIGIQAMAARLYFDENDAAFQVFECGKGVQFDDVGSIPHQTAVMTPVFREHLRELGGSLEAIARDKAHILQPGTRTLILARQEPVVRQIILDRAALLGVQVLEYGQDFRISSLRRDNDGIRFDVQTPHHAYRDVFLPTLAKFQAENCALALMAAQVMMGKPARPAAMAGLRFAGRQEVLSRSPLWLLDACINRESAQQLADSLTALDVKDALVILAVPDDKDPTQTARILAPFAGEIRICPVRSGHYRISPVQCRLLSDLEIPVTWRSSLEEALADDMPPETSEAPGSRAVVLAGTTAFVSDVCHWLTTHPIRPTGKEPGKGGESPEKDGGYAE